MLSPIQFKLLEMLKWFHGYCLKENINYYAVGGTMIGAMRHKGFIPWDDDIDIAIPRKDYDRLIRNFTGIIDGYLLESPYSGNSDYLYSYAKIYDTRTTLVEKTRVPCKRGIYIDVFPLDGIGNSYEEAERLFRKFDKKNMFLMTRTCVVRNDRSWYKNASIIASRVIPNFILDDKKLSIAVDRLAESMNDDNSKFIANLMGAYRSKEITLREYFGKPTLYQFEGMAIYGPEKCDEYLTNIYKNWKQLPPEDKRYTKHDFVVCDLEKSYLQN
ncbi:lipopolysaccharide cholinephosphotransferase [Eubacterium uniforme]|uniref:Lipopolysaccharide cholinephosphotransferase n=1 Tax=Eubacterium uniforme TaxID=39495 RepID=A0A1T4VD86_9FIRM|nr:LicD family protein [Eubacterium uniforme]SKA62856.1 lipopolysaccharide cholinephosphotransferase [Eubacterium uniforme]